MRTRSLSKREEMVMYIASETAVRELDRRETDGFDVRLLWNSQTNHVFVAIEDDRYGESIRLDVDPADALEAFHHPFAYSRTDHHRVVTPT
jgi:hypothetical protein